MYSLGDYTEADWTAALKQAHTYAVSLADSKARYEQTHDSRYLASMQSMLPYFKQAIAKANAINVVLYQQDLPSGFMTALSDFSDFIINETGQLASEAKHAVGVAVQAGEDVVGAAADTVKTLPKLANTLFSPFVLLAIAGVAFMALGGSKLLPKRH